MIYSTSPQPKTLGSPFAQSASASTVYPSDGVGGTTGTAGNSIVSGKRVLVLGYTYGPHVASGTLTITDGGGNDIHGFGTPGAVPAGTPIPFGRGILSNNGFGFRVSGGSTVTVWYVEI